MRKCPNILVFGPVQEPKQTCVVIKGNSAFNGGRDYHAKTPFFAYSNLLAYGQFPTRVHIEFIEKKIEYTILYYFQMKTPIG